MSKYKEMGLGLHLFVTDDPMNLWRLSDYVLYPC